MKLSIIIPVYNAEKYLEKCLNSVLEQVDEQMEVIIVNDGSTDSSLEICEKYVEKYSCIKLINKINEGVSKARNVAIKQAQGEWITFLDADDMLQKNSLGKVKALEGNADVVLCDYAKKQVDNESRGTILCEMPKDLMMKGILNLPSYENEIRSYKYMIDGITNWTCWGKFFRTRIIKDNEIEFSEAITHGEDLLFCYQIYLYATSVYYESICLYYYRINEQSVSHTFNEKRITNTLGLFENFLKLDSQIACNKDFYYFIVDRIIACCRMYFGNENNCMIMNEKVKQLKKLMQDNIVSEAIKSCPMKKLSLGKKTNILNIIILFLLKNNMYKQAIWVSKI